MERIKRCSYSSDKIAEFENRYGGEYWYLREFDYYPERMSYRNDISYQFMKEAKEGRYKLYKNEFEAWMDCLRIRKMIYGNDSDNRWIIDRICKSLTDVNGIKLDVELFKTLIEVFKKTP